MTEKQRQLWKNHRVFGWEVARFVAPDGIERVVLDTGNGQEAIVRAHMLMTVGPQEAAFDLRIGLSELVSRARFLGVPIDALRGMLDEEAAHDH